ncbi:P-loop containing nucleoside triphosphate hydrolase protein [Kockovaella imperatae]|uniref:Peroxisomal ATPase PEX1 n=1 Tax=Kockovaella imperatae TaxID=4999 RepID=A0A1Y1UQC6_9TREE|nr:P-loop containing nucleoside triphosphate hydrolase protein [Kockovaella imperatae]ORX40268.1 P-loop containing nucleoside triphosphate hydrolase protein [Kockovaella imperatae]
MSKRATIKYRSLRSNLVHLPLSLYATLAQQQVRPQGIILHLSPIASSSSSSGRRPQEGYLGWSGLASASSLSSGLAGIGNAGAGGREGSIGTIEVDPEVAMDLGWAEGTTVEISIINRPTKAKSVSVTPLSSDDWEILEEHASFLENHLLGQLRAARPKQEVNVWVLGNTKIRIRIDETSPSGKDSAVVIGPDTEIYVAPRPRKKEPNSPDHPRTVIEPERAADSGNTRDGKGKRPGAGPSVRLRHIPSNVAGGWGTPEWEVNSIPGGAKSQNLAFASVNTILRVRQRLQCGGKGFLYINVKSWADAKDKSVIREANSDDVANTNQSEEEDGVELYLLPWDEVPDGHVVTTATPVAAWTSWSWLRVRKTVNSPSSSRRKADTSYNADFSLANEPLAPLIGYDTIINTATRYLCRAFHSSSPRPLLVTGAKGSGKTSLVRYLARALSSDRDILAEPIYHDVTTLDLDGRTSELKDKLIQIFEDATRRRPVLLVFDGLDHLLHPQNELNSSTTSASLTDTFCRLFATAQIPRGLLVVATASNKSAIHPLLNSKHIFGQEVRIPPLDKARREQILRGSVAARRLAIGASAVPATANSEELDFVGLSGETEGYSPADLKDLIDLAVQQSIIRSLSDDQKDNLTQDDFAASLQNFSPSSLKGVKLQQSTVSWSDIGGLAGPRRVLRETLEWPTKYAQIFQNCPLRLRSGLLLYGYPGCGKTLLASAVAKECGLNFISVKGPEVLNKYIGASEKAIRDLFERASGAKPCILFFDEFDSIAPKRGHDSTGVTDRVVNQLLTEMDGAQGLEGVYVLAATSRPDLIDPALLRPGRLDKAVLCDMPSYADRLEIIRTVARKMDIVQTVDLELIAHDTEGFSGADLQAIMYNAHLEVVQSSVRDLERSEINEDHTEIRRKGKGKGKANGHVPKPEPNAKRGWKQIAPLDAEHDSDAARRLDELVSRLSASQSRTEENDLSTVPKLVIEQQHLLHSLVSTRPSVSAADYHRLSNIYRSFLGGRDGMMGNGDHGRETGTRVSLM